MGGGSEGKRKEGSTVDGGDIDIEEGLWEWVMPDSNEDPSTAAWSLKSDVIEIRKGFTVDSDVDVVKNQAWREWVKAKGSGLKVVAWGLKSDMDREAPTASMCADSSNEICAGIPS